MRLWHLLARLGLKNKNKNVTNFPKIYDFLRSRNYNARGLIVKYMLFVLISIIKFYLTPVSPLSDKSGHILLSNIKNK